MSLFGKLRSNPTNLERLPRVRKIDATCAGFREILRARDRDSANTAREPADESAAHGFFRGKECDAAA